MKTIWNRAGRLALVLLLLFALSVGETAPLVEQVQAVTQGEIDALEDDAENLAKQRKELKSQLADLKNDKMNALKRRNLLDQDIDLATQEIANTESQIAGYEVLLTQTAYELEENRQEEADRYEIFCQRTRAMEENGTASYWAVLFKAEDFSDLLSRLSDIQEVMDYDQSVLDNLRNIRTEIEEKQTHQEELKGEAESVKADLEAKKEELEAKRAEANALVQEIESGVDEYEDLLEEIRQEEERVQKEIVKKADELAAQMGWDATVGGYIWPQTKSKRITSPYGKRKHPISGKYSMHNGVDIGGVGYDTNILATKAGVVITSAYHSSYGNYVVVSHGRGNTTLYAHMSSRKVAEGDTVTQGQVIGITGSTGNSTGPHIHYEITENGKRVDPLQYLPGYVQAWS